jgi:hypothetical protein
VSFTHFQETVEGLSEWFSTGQRGRDLLTKAGLGNPSEFLAFGLFDCQFSALEPDAAVGTVAERLVHRAAAAAERKGGLAGQVVLSSIDVDEFY